MSSSQDPEAPRSIERFRGEHPSRDVDDWYWLWSNDHSLPIESHRGGLIGRLIVGLKRLLRPLVKVPQQDLWDRQRTFNLVILEEIRRINDLRIDLDAVDARLRNLETCFEEGLREVTRANDALYSRIDLKLEHSLESTRRLQRDLRQVADLFARDGATAPSDQPNSGSATTVNDVLSDFDYVSFEDRHRGSEAEITERIEPYVSELEAYGPVFDLGCGRGELLRRLRANGVAARGVDANAAMVRRCVEDLELDVIHGDLIEALEAVEPGSLGAVVCLHVVEHLDAATLQRLLERACRALRAGGILLVETPNPLSIVAGARNFWRDGTHLRPVHPDRLVAACRSAGFDRATYETCHPFAANRRLPEIDFSTSSESGSAVEKRTSELYRELAALRDAVDELLYGDQDYVLRAYRD